MGGGVAGALALVAAAPRTSPAGPSTTAPTGTSPRRRRRRPRRARPHRGVRPGGLSVIAAGRARRRTRQPLGDDRDDVRRGARLPHAELQQLLGAWSPRSLSRSRSPAGRTPSVGVSRSVATPANSPSSSRQVGCEATARASERNTRGSSRRRGAHDREPFVLDLDAEQRPARRRRRPQRPRARRRRCRRRSRCSSRSTSAPVQPASVSAKAAEKCDSRAIRLPRSADGRIRSRARTAPEPEPRGDAGQHLVGQQVEVAGEMRRAPSRPARGQRRSTGRRRAAPRRGPRRRRAPARRGIEHLPGQRPVHGAAMSERKTSTRRRATRSATKKSSPTATRPIVAPSLGCWRSAWISPCRSDVSATGSSSASQRSSSRKTTMAKSSASVVCHRRSPTRPCTRAFTSLAIVPDQAPAVAASAQIVIKTVTATSGHASTQDSVVLLWRPSSSTIPSSPTSSPRLRDERTDSPTFRRLADELVTLLAYEATRDVRVDRGDGRPPRRPGRGRAAGPAAAAGGADPAGRAGHARRHDAAAADRRGRLPRA